jgi:hypothetical protein
LAISVQFSKQNRYRLPVASYFDFWGDFIEGNEDKGTICEARMGNFEVRFAELKIAEEKDIQVQRSGPVDDATCTITSIFLFDAEKGVKEGLRGQFCLQRDDRVEEARLFGKTNGTGAVEG